MIPHSGSRWRACRQRVDGSHSMGHTRSTMPQSHLDHIAVLGIWSCPRMMAGPSTMALLINYPQGDSCAIRAKMPGLWESASVETPKQLS
jgi:hypothetical protein